MKKSKKTDISSENITVFFKQDIKKSFLIVFFIFLLQIALYLLVINNIVIF